MWRNDGEFSAIPPHAGFTNFHTASDHYGNVITHTLDNDTLLDLCMRVSFVPYRRGQRKIQLLIRLLLPRQSREQNREVFNAFKFC